MKSKKQIQEKIEELKEKLINEKGNPAHIVRKEINALRWVIE
jgi:protein-arginine kinase activator protein McsA